MEEENVECTGNDEDNGAKERGATCSIVSFSPEKEEEKPGPLVLL